MRITVIFAILLSLFGIVSNAAEKEQMPLATLSGADSEVRTASYRRLTSPEEWAQTWANHLGTSVDDAYRPHFEVDFGRCMVVVIFRGEKRNSRGIQIDSAAETEDAVVICFTQLGYQTSGADNNKPPDRPYAFIVLPATSKTIVFEENFPNMKGTSPEWKEVARMEGQELIPDRQ
ncbi:MAG: hypothetical protein AB7G28_07545 [Pirellulales bacterium]